MRGDVGKKIEKPVLLLCDRAASQYGEMAHEICGSSGCVRFAWEKCKPCQDHGVGVIRQRWVKEGGFDQAAWIDRTGFAMLRTEEVANVVVVRYLPRVTRVRSAISNTIRPRHASRHCHASGTDEARYLPDVLGADPQLWRHSMNNSNHRYNLRRFTPTGMHGVSIRR